MLHCTFQLRKLNNQLFGKELFVRVEVGALRERSSIFVCASFPFGFEDGIWDLIAIVPDQCTSFYFTMSSL